MVRNFSVFIIAGLVAAGTYVALGILYPGDEAPSRVTAVEPVEVPAEPTRAPGPVPIPPPSELELEPLEAEPAPETATASESLDDLTTPSSDPAPVANETEAAEAAIEDDPGLGEEPMELAESGDDVAETPAESTAVAMTEPAPAPAPAAPAKPAPAPAAAKPAQKKSEPVAKPKAASSTKPAPAAPAQTAWWASDEAPQNLSLVYAGSASYTRAVALLFNGIFQDTVSADAHLRVEDAQGKRLEGRWQISAGNSRMLVFPVSRAGTYVVKVGTGLADGAGRSPARALQGPVSIP